MYGIGEAIKEQIRRSTYKFGDNHCPSGYRWFARRRIGLGRRDVDHSEASGPARLVGQADCATGDAVFRLHCESARLLVDAMQHNVSDLQKLLPVYALLSRIRLSSSEPVLQTAEKVIKTIVNTYPQPNLTADQIESRAVNGQDPLRQFSDTCRTELESLQRQM